MAIPPTIPGSSDTWTLPHVPGLIPFDPDEALTRWVEKRAYDIRRNMNRGDILLAMARDVTGLPSAASWRRPSPLKRCGSEALPGTSEDRKAGLSFAVGRTYVLVM